MSIFGSTDNQTPTNSDIISYIEEAEAPDYQMAVLEGDNDEYENIQNEYVNSQEQNESREESFVSSAINWVSDKISELNPFDDVDTQETSSVRNSPAGNFESNNASLDDITYDELINIQDSTNDNDNGMNDWLASIEDSESIAKNIKSDLNFAFPLKTSKLTEHIKSINKSNILDVLNYYEGVKKIDNISYYKRLDEMDMSLFSEIIGTRSLSFDERAECCNHIMLELCKAYEEKGVYTDDLLKDIQPKI